jgi:type I restriction enzyme S subunit
MLERSISTAGWTRVAFGDVVRLSKARVADPEAAEVERVVGLEHIEPGDLRIRRWGDVADGTTFTTLFKPGQVLFGKRRAYQRKVAVADFEGVCSGDIYVLEPANDRLMPELLPFLCQTDAFFDHAVGTSAGSLSPRTNWTSLASFEFLLPPIQEQARLLEALLAANDVRDGLGNVADSAAMAMRSLCKTLFIEPRKTIARTRIGEVATVRNGTTPSRTNPDFWKGDVPWLPTGKVNERYIEAADECITALALRKCSLRLIPAGSTLVAMIGEGTTRGKAALLRIDATTNQNFAAVSPGEALVPEFLFYQLESCYEPLRHWSHGTNQHALNTKLVSDFPIWVPSIEEQHEIVTEIAALESQRMAAERRRDSFQSVYSKISDKVLEGFWV